MSMNPGRTYIPAASISWSGFCGSRLGLSGNPGVPALRIALIRLFSITMSTERCGGAPVPSISMAPRMTRVLNGPRPSSGPRFGAGLIRGGGSCAGAIVTAPRASARARAGITAMTTIDLVLAIRVLLVESSKSEHRGLRSCGRQRLRLLREMFPAGSQRHGVFAWRHYALRPVRRTKAAAELPGDGFQIPHDTIQPGLRRAIERANRIAFCVSHCKRDFLLRLFLQVVDESNSVRIIRRDGQPVAVQTIISERALTP